MLQALCVEPRAGHAGIVGYRPVDRREGEEPGPLHVSMCQPDQKKKGDIINLNQGDARLSWAEEREWARCATGQSAGHSTSRT